jgi:hypothetical protein
VIRSRAGCDTQEMLEFIGVWHRSFCRRRQTTARLFFLIIFAGARPTARRHGAASNTGGVLSPGLGCPRGSTSGLWRKARDLGSGKHTHALRIVRGVLLKGNGLAEIAPELWPIAVFALVIALIATWSYRETID